MIRTWICIHALNKGQEILFSACHIAGDASTRHWFTILNAVHTCHCLLNESSTLLPCIFAQCTGSSGWGCSNLRMDVQFTCNKIKALYEKSPVNVKIEPPSIFSFTRYTVACWVLDQNGLKNPYACVGRSSILCSTQVASIACLKQHTSRLFLSPFASLVTSRWPLKLKLWLCSKRWSPGAKTGPPKSCSGGAKSSSCGGPKGRGTKSSRKTRGPKSSGRSETRGS